MPRPGVVLSESDIQEIVRLYTEEYVSMRNLARRYRCGEIRISSLLRERGIEIKPVGTAFLKESFETRLLRYTEKTESCWLWKGARTEFGHGIFAVKSEGRTRNFMAHRISWELYRGEIPPDLKVLHRCDVPNCVNPDHLFLGTQKDNVADMIQKGRARYRGLKGESNGRAKLTENQVAGIRARHASGETIAILAERYNVSRTQIRRIVTGKLWNS